MTESAQGLSVDKHLRHNVDGLGFGQTEQFGHDGGRGQFDEDDMVESDSVERVLESHATLDLVSHDGGLEHVLHGQSGATVGNVGA